MGSKAENSIKDNTYRHELRKYIMGRVNSPEFEEKLRETYVTELPHLKQQIHKIQQPNSDLENGFNAIQKNNPAACGGDADRMLNCSMYATYHIDEYCRTHNNDNFSIKYKQSSSKPFAPALTPNARTSLGKCDTSAFQNCSGDHNYLFENDSALRGLGKNSEDSAKSQKSSKTVVSRKSSHDLKKLVKSQCKLNKEIGQTLKGICNTEAESFDIHDACDVQNGSPNLLPLGLSQCKRCSERLDSNPSQKEIGKGSIFDCRYTNTLTISVDDVINSRVIIPMIQKIHRMYLNNLKEEMSLMEDLERLPNKVNEVYKSIILKQKD